MAQSLFACQSTTWEMTNKVYILFETNGGYSSYFIIGTGAWLSKDRGKIPIGWAADPYLGTIFPELWIFMLAIRLKTILLLMVWTGQVTYF